MLSDNEPMILPQPVIDLYKAQQAVHQHYAHTKLKFTLDGRLVGDIGEALVMQHYGMMRTEQREPGVDGYAPNQTTTLQVKATQFEFSGPSFSVGEGTANLLLFLWVDFQNGVAWMRYNGPEAPIRKHLPVSHKSTATVKLFKVEADNKTVAKDQRLPRLR